MRARYNALSVLIAIFLTGCAGMQRGDSAATQTQETDAVVMTQASQTDTEGFETEDGPPVRAGFPTEGEQTAATQPASADTSSSDASARASDTVQVSCPEPAAAQAGQCFTRVLNPPQYREEQVQVLVRPEYEQITYTEPAYEEVQERVLVREAYTREVDVPALYDTYYEQVLEKPAAKVWKKGRGAVEQVDAATGEIYCLVDEPAVYRTVERKELKRPAGTRTETVPAEYTTTTVQKLVKKPEEVRTVVPAEYTTVARKALAGPASCEYTQVLCEDNATQAKIQEVEQALTAKGYEVDSDGVIDASLTAALEKYQAEQGLPQTGLMTARTLESLGVALEPVQQDTAAQSQSTAPASSQ